MRSWVVWENNHPLRFGKRFHGSDFWHGALVASVVIKDMDGIVFEGSFNRPGHERNRRTLDEISRLTSRLHANTKFDKLVKWGAANLFYVVAEPGTVEVHELPACWGLLVRDDSALRLVAKPVMHEIGESERLSLLHRISMAATRAVNREQGVGFDEVTNVV